VVVVVVVVVVVRLTTMTTNGRRHSGRDDERLKQQILSAVFGSTPHRKFAITGAAHEPCAFFAISESAPMMGNLPVAADVEEDMAVPIQHNESRLWSRQLQARVAAGPPAAGWPGKFCRSKSFRPGRQPLTHVRCTDDDWAIGQTPLCTSPSSSPSACAQTSQLLRSLVSNGVRRARPRRGRHNCVCV
jgi:hypothetical protein